MTEFETLFKKDEPPLFYFRFISMKQILQWEKLK